MKTAAVTCIMPTANRPNFVLHAVNYFLNQNFRDAELIIVDDGKESILHLIPAHHRIKYYFISNVGLLGNKRNYACSKATADIIMHWDDDDYYGQDWIGDQIDFLKASNADIVGLNHIIFYSPLVKKFWEYKDKNIERPWIAGATMAYRKSFWKDHPFRDINIGEDYDYIWNSGAKVVAHDYPDGFIATLHAWNTTLKPFENIKHKKNAIEYMDVVFKGDAENP
jgi:glycosyltransferase involved in cell wall biosynthesis